MELTQGTHPASFQPTQDMSKFRGEILPAWLKRLNLCVPMLAGWQGAGGRKGGPLCGARRLNPHRFRSRPALR